MTVYNDDYKHFSTKYLAALLCRWLDPNIPDYSSPQTDAADTVRNAFSAIATSEIPNIGDRQIIRGWNSISASKITDDGYRSHVTGFAGYEAIKPVYDAIVARLKANPDTLLEEEPVSRVEPAVVNLFREIGTVALGSELAQS